MQSYKDNRPLIIGAGVFGLSTALELKLRGYKKVTVADRYPPPVKDGSSVDVSRVIRTDYADELYHRIAREAYELWKEGIYREDLHEMGFVMLGERSGQSYLDKALEVNEAQGVALDNYPDANDVRQLYLSIQAKLDGLRAVHIPNGGWADAEGAIRRLAGEYRPVGSTLQPNTLSTTLPSVDRPTGTGCILVRQTFLCLNSSVCMTSTRSRAPVSRETVPFRIGIVKTSRLTVDGWSTDRL